MDLDRLLVLRARGVLFPAARELLDLMIARAGNDSRLTAVDKRCVALYDANTMKTYTKATRAMLREAIRNGKRLGMGAADPQYFPGGGRDTARDAQGRAAAMLREYDEDCPEWAQPPAWLSGEWADEPVCRDVARDCGVDPDRDPDGSVADEVCNAYVAAADGAFLDAILRHLRHVAQEGAR